MREVLSSPGRLRGVVDGLIADLPSYRERAREMREDLYPYDGAKAAAEHLEVFLAGRLGVAAVRSPVPPLPEENG